MEPPDPAGKWERGDRVLGWRLTSRPARYSTDGS